MADTIRTESALLTTLFQDGQAANEITAQDMRDLIVSMRPGFGETSMQNNTTATTVSVASTFYKVAGTTTLSGDEYLFDNDSGTSNRLRYTGASEKLVLFRASLSFKPASNNQNFSLKAYLYDDSAGSGALITSTLVTHFASSTTDTESTTIIGHALMSTNDYVEIHIANDTSTADVTVVGLNLNAAAHIK